MGRLEKLQKRVETMVTKAAEKVAGPILRKMPPAQLANVVRASMRVCGVDACRKQIMDGIEDVFRENLKANPDLTADELFQNFMTGDESSPELLAVLKELGLDEEHIRVLADGIKKGGD